MLGSNSEELVEAVHSRKPGREISAPTVQRRCFWVTPSAQPSLDGADEFFGEDLGCFRELAGADPVASLRRFTVSIGVTEVLGRKKYAVCVFSRNLCKV